MASRKCERKVDLGCAALLMQNGVGQEGAGWGANIGHGADWRRSPGGRVAPMVPSGTDKNKIQIRRTRRREKENEQLSGSHRSS
jgi:hypothetical protein